MMAAAVFQYRSRRAEHAPEQGRILQRFVGIASVVDSASMSRIGVKAPGMIVVMAPVGFCWQMLRCFADGRLTSADFKR
jgi:hypothetical protein